MSNQRRFEFGVSLTKAYKTAEGAMRVIGVASDNLPDVQGDAMGEEALLDMALQCKSNSLPLLDNHRSTFGFGKTVDGTIHSDGERKMLFVEFELDQKYPQSLDLFHDVQGGKCDKQMSIGGKLDPMDPNAVSIDRAPDGRMFRRIRKIMLDHIAATRGGFAANERTGWLSAIMKALEGWESPQPDNRVAKSDPPATTVRVELVDTQFTRLVKEIVSTMSKNDIEKNTGKALLEKENASLRAYVDRSNAIVEEALGVQVHNDTITKGGVPYKKYATDEDAWSFSPEDGDALLGDKGDNWERFKASHSWFDAKADPDHKNTPQVKGAYKLPHHKLVGDQMKTFFRGVVAAAAALVGGRGGTTIPTAEMSAVASHLAKHYGDFDRQPPDSLSNLAKSIEIQPISFEAFSNEHKEKGIDISVLITKEDWNKIMETPTVDANKTAEPVAPVVEKATDAEVGLSLLARIGRMFIGKSTDGAPTEAPTAPAETTTATTETPSAEAPAEVVKESPVTLEQLLADPELAKAWKAKLDAELEKGKGKMCEKCGQMYTTKDCPCMANAQPEDKSKKAKPVMDDGDGDIDVPGADDADADDAKPPKGKKKRKPMKPEDAGDYMKDAVSKLTAALATKTNEEVLFRALDAALEQHGSAMAFGPGGQKKLSSKLGEDGSDLFKSAVSAVEALLANKDKVEEVAALVDGFAANSGWTELLSTGLSKDNVAEIVATATAPICKSFEDLSKSVESAVAALKTLTEEINSVKNKSKELEDSKAKTEAQLKDIDASVVKCATELAAVHKAVGARVETLEKAAGISQVITPTVGPDDVLAPSPTPETLNKEEEVAPEYAIFKGALGGAIGRFRKTRN